MWWYDKKQFYDLNRKMFDELAILLFWAYYENSIPKTRNLYRTFYKQIDKIIAAKNYTNARYSNHKLTLELSVIHWRLKLNLRMSGIT